MSKLRYYRKRPPAPDLYRELEGGLTRIMFTFTEAPGEEDLDNHTRLLHPMIVRSLQVKPYGKKPYKGEVIISTGNFASLIVTPWDTSNAQNLSPVAGIDPTQYFFKLSQYFSVFPDCRIQDVALEWKIGTQDDTRPGS